MAKTGKMSSLKRQVDNLLERELEWQKQKIARKEEKLCKWFDCPLKGSSIENMWEHVQEYHVFWQPFLDANGNPLISSAKEEEKDDDGEEGQLSLNGRKSRQLTNKDHVCLWDECLLFKKPMKRDELMNHILKNHIKISQLKMPQVERPRSHEYSKEVLAFMKEEVVNRLKTEAGMATDEPTYKTLVRMIDGSLREAKPDEVLADGETLVNVFDARLYGAHE